ncbi:MAG: 6-phosphogluconolactonase [Henriciella sp.]|nr:6-phosphogluconolactonase [Henriciella sp.]
MTQGHVFKSFDSKADLQSAAADWIAAALRDAIARRGGAVFMCSGGSTPGPIYETLSNAELAWDQVQVGLCDERWVEANHPASNGAMLERTLLQNRASEASYTPMKVAGNDPFRAVEQVDELYMDASLTDVMLLGMGPDAHTLSWFKGGRGYDEAISSDSTSVVAAVEAIESEVTGPNLLRMTLTQPCVAYARNILLLITGAEKKAVFESAPADAPVSIMKRAAGDSLTVFYCE